MADGNHIIGSLIDIPVKDRVNINNRYYFIVKLDDRLIRVPLFDWQINSDNPDTICCRLISINQFGYPTVEQVAHKDELNLVDAPNKKVELKTNHETLSFQNKYVKPIAPVAIKPINSPQLDSQRYKANDNFTEHDLSFYRWSNQEDSFEDWFINTGGIKARLQILISLASQLADYHRQNKVYKELVPVYIKVANDKNNTLTVILPKTNYITSGFNDIFIYASYAAPEVVNRRIPNTPMSDCYTFAIIAFELLEFCHPFLGDNVLKNNLYEDAFKGRLPWIDDPSDSSNRLIHRYYDRYFITTRLWKLIERTFTVGMYDIYARPTIYDWQDALIEEMKTLRFCSDCKTDFLCTDIEDECPFCDNLQDFKLVVDIAFLTEIFDINSFDFSNTEFELEEKLIYSTYLNESNSLIVTSQDLNCVESKDTELLSIKVVSSDENKIKTILEPLNKSSFFVATSNLQKYSQKIERATSVSFTKQSNRSLVLSIDDLNAPQRVIILTAIY